MGWLDVLLVMVELQEACFSDFLSYTGGSVAAGRISLTGQVGAKIRQTKEQPIGPL
jgi:hypothetical protein